MQRLRIRYTKEGRVRFVSARDLTSVWERALRRADLPIAYSEGFSPHPKVSFPDALPVGVASTGEYAELTFAAPIDPRSDLAALSATLPEGIDILTFQHVEDGAPKLARVLEAALWEVEYPAPATPDELEAFLIDLGARTDALLAADAAAVPHRRPDGNESLVDVRPALVALHADTREPDDPSAPAVPTVRAVLRNDGPAVRPRDLHEALTRVAADAAPLPEPQLLRRVAQGRLDADGLREALTGELIPLRLRRHAGAA